MEKLRVRSSGAHPAAAIVLFLLLVGPLPRRAEAAAAEQKPPDATSHFAAAMEPIEAKVQAWDFSGAAKALTDLSSDDDALAERLATRRAEVAILAKLKARMIAKINDATPRLRKGTLLIPGMNADLTEADEEGTTAQHTSGKAERFLWKNLPVKSVRRLAELASDRTKGDDHLALGLLAMVCNDSAAAEKDLEEAKALGVAVERHLVPLADTALAKALALADRQQFPKAEEALQAIEVKFAKTPWFAAHKQAVEAALRKVRGDAAEVEAGKLYEQAAKLFQEKELFELKPIVAKLQSDFGKTQVVTDAARKPSVAEMAQAAAKLGKLITVRQNGKGDFRSIQEAVNAAPPNGLVLVADSATYHEVVRVPNGKEGLILRGKKGAWPTITSERFHLMTIADLVRTDCPRVTVEGFVLNHCANQNFDGAFACVDVLKPPVTVRSCILYMAWKAGQAATIEGKSAQSDVIGEFDHCVIALPPGGGFWSGVGGTIAMTNCIWLGGNIRATFPGTAEAKPRTYRFNNVVLQEVSLGGPGEFQSCTILGSVLLEGKPNLLRDCIVRSVQVSKRGTELEHCDVYGTPAYAELAQPGKGCFSARPAFRDPDKFDYRLRPTSPCRKKASDGGDIGCRYTPEMFEILQKALDLRAKGIISF